MQSDLISIFFPSELLLHFEVTSFEQKKSIDTDEEYYEITFEEKNILPEFYSTEEYESKGFMKSKRIQDFPIRGRAVYIFVKKRRWRHKKTKKIIQRDFSFMCKGAKFTTDLSDFLKETGRY